MTCQGPRPWCLAAALLAAGGISLAAQPASTDDIEPSSADHSLDLDLGLQLRAFSKSGLDGQSRTQGSVSAQLEYYRAWNEDRSSLTFTPFVRVDGEDDERTHFDVRELFWSRVGPDWDLHLGAKQVFWGVTEFKHLVDVINQTDLVENIDGEDKLGQPMAHLSVVRDWGILDFYLLTGFRERTFPGSDGRLRPPLPVDDDARYESGAGRWRVDGAVRWQRQLGRLTLGIHHFSGTSRAPVLIPETGPAGQAVLRPFYPVIDQTGLDAQAIVGDWAWKLEAVSSSGYEGRYSAFNAGFERSLVGVLGGRGDLGLVVEYMFDDRDERAFDTLFEHDLALGTRWQMNDVADTQALIGVIWDVKTDEYVVKLEGSRRLGDTWTLLVEGRIFGGSERPMPGVPPSTDPNNRAWPLERDDFLQLELTRYF